MVSSTTPSSGEYLLEMSGINKSFPGVKALDNVNLKVRPHSIHALMGENGAGKSTLLKCLFGIYQKTPAPFCSVVKRSIFILPKKHWKMVFRWYTRIKPGITTFGDGQHVAGAISHQRHVCRSGQNVPRNQSDF